jgi:hypothetical protein
MKHQSYISIFGAAILAGAFSIGAALADEPKEEEIAANAVMTAQEEMAERTNSCERYNSNSARWTTTVALDNDPRHTPCVRDTGTRNRSRDAADDES